jgi:hypothetical protein
VTEKPYDEELLEELEQADAEARRELQALLQEVDGLIEDLKD